MTTEESLSPAEQAAIERLRAAYADASRIEWPFSPSDVTEQAPHPRRHRRRPRPGPWTHRVMVVAVAAVILVVFFVPLPHLSLFHRLVTPTKPTVPTASKQPPVGTQLAELGSEVGPHSQFSVGVSGSTAVVGLQVITKTAAGWKQTAELKSSDTDSNGCLGLSNAISGDTIVESDPCYANLTGRSYVFTKTTRGWEQTDVLNGSDSVPNDKFGYPVAISGTTIVVGAQNAGADNAGRAYVFTKTTKGWKQVAELNGSDTVPNDQFGISVAISGTTIAVGASYHTDDAGRAYEAGSAYVFTKTTKGWKQVAELKGSDTVTFDNFGISVAISGTTSSSVHKTPEFIKPAGPTCSPRRQPAGDRWPN